MKWLAQILFWLLGLCFLLLIGVSLLGFTHVGNQWLWLQAQKQLPALKGELVAGQLGYGWTLEHLSWQGDGVRIAARRVELDWDLGRLLKGELWIRNLALDGAEVQVDEGSEPQSDTVEPSPPAEPDTSSAEAWRPLPLRIELQQLSVNGLSVHVPDVSLTLASGKLGAQFTRHGLTVRKPFLRGLDLRIGEQSQQPGAPSASDKEDNEPIALPAVHLPFPVLVQSLRLEQGHYRDSSLDEPVPLLELDGSMVDDLVQIDRLHLDHPLADATLKGRITLSSDYPLSARLDGTLGKMLLDGRLAGEQLSLRASGSVAKLAFELAGKGAVSATAKGSLQPLEPSLPFAASINWPALDWPLAARKEDLTRYHLKKGSLSAQGSLDNYQLTLVTSGEGSDVPPFTLDVKAKGDRTRFSALTLGLKALDGEIKIKGALGWHKGISWQGQGEFANLNPAWFDENIKGALSGAVDSRFTLDEQGHWQLALPKTRIEGRVNQWPLTLDGELTGNDALRWQIPGLTLVSGANRLAVKGSLAPERWQLDASVQAPELTGLYPGLKGALSGSATLRGNANKPAVKLDLTASRLYYSGLDLLDAALKGDVTLGPDPAGEVSARVAEIKQDGVNLKGLTAQLSGTRSQHNLTLSVRGNPIGTDLRLTGHSRGDRWQGQLEQWVVRSPLRQWSLHAPWSLDVDTRRWQARHSGLCLDSQDASLCIKPGTVAKTAGEAEFALTHFNLTRLRPWLPEGFVWQSVLSADGRIGWRGAKPELHARVRTTPGTFRSDQITTAYETLLLELDLDPKQASVALAFESNALGKLNTRMQVADPMGRGALGGELALDALKPDAFAALIPDVRELKGILSGQARFDGTLKRPLLFGDIRLRDGKVLTTSDMLTLNGLDTRLTIAGEQADIDGKVLVGKGPLTLGGSLNWATLPVQGNLTLRGKDLEAQYPGMGRVRVTPDLTIALGEQTRISGSIAIPWARINVKNLPESAVTVSDDVVIVQDAQAPAKPATTLPLWLRVQVAIGPDVQLDALGLRTHLAGQVRLSQDEGTPLAARGDIMLSDGRFRAYGQNLIIQQGRIRFSGPLDEPYLNVDAIRNPDTVEDDVTVGVKVTGPASKPTLTVYSNPTLSESERLSYLLRGKGLSTNGEDSGMNGLLLSGAVGLGGGVVSSVGESLGLSDVSLDTTGSGDDTQVTLSAYLLPGLQLQYGVGVFSPIAEFKLRYELMPKLYLQAMTGLAQAVDLFYRFEF